MMVDREKIYYWKSDRPFVSENTRTIADASSAALEGAVKNYLMRFLRRDVPKITTGQGQGNHITFVADYQDTRYFIRIENGPEGDDYMVVSSTIMERVRSLNVPCPIVYLTDASRKEVPFAIQVIEYIRQKDLNQWSQSMDGNLVKTAFDIGRYVGRWQGITPDGFGLFNVSTLSKSGMLQGHHAAYCDYFYLNFERHLHCLAQSGFLSDTDCRLINELATAHESLLDIERGCLVHKDLALWNILGDGYHISAFIDWDDAISGDPVDDLSLLACFHSGDMVSAAIEGYKEVRSLPGYFVERFWLHMLRNMVFKSVIRVRGNYFDLPDSFFLNGGRENNLRTVTLSRIKKACEGLRGQLKISDL